MADTVLPLEWPITATDGKTIIDKIEVKKGQTVTVAIMAANRNKKLWGEDAEEWKPERWLKDAPAMKGGLRLPGAYSSM